MVILMIKRTFQDLLLLALGGISYGIIELLWRHRTHWSMVVTGGVCFVTLYRIFSKIKNTAIFIKCIIGSTVITVVELIVGCVVNLQLKLEVWDYSKMPFNLLGQICPLYSILWGGLTLPIIFVCNKLQKHIK